MIKIGNAACTGINRLVICNSKAAAVRELRERGLTRDKARKIVNLIWSQERLYISIPTNPKFKYFDCIEVASVI
jgi:hypothetical protein